MALVVMLSLVDVVGSKLVVAYLFYRQQRDTGAHTPLLILSVPAINGRFSLSLGFSEVAVLVASSCPTLAVDKELKSIHSNIYQVA